MCFKRKFITTILLVSCFQSIPYETSHASTQNPIDYAATNLKLDNLKDQANVAIDTDNSRLDFENEVNNPKTESTPTTVTVEKSDQIANLDKHKKKAIEDSTYISVNSWESLKSAYQDNTKTYIQITNNISAPENVNARDLGWREQSIIIDGGGYTINTKTAAFNVGTRLSPRESIFTITNANIIHWQTTSNIANAGTAPQAVIDTATGVGGLGYWRFNIDNVTLEGRDGPNGAAAYQPRRLLNAEDSQVTLSGKIIVSAKQELMQIGQVDIVNNSHIELNRTLGTTGYSMFYFLGYRIDNALDTGYDHTFTVGDGSTIIGTELDTYNSNNYPLVYYGFNSMKIGDNVDWMQDGFQMLVDMNRYTGSKRTNRSVTFGQNLKMTAKRTVGSNSLYATNQSNITFNAGTTLDLQQWNNNYVVRSDANSNIKFISPKELHLSRNSSTGSPVAGAIFYGAGTFTMNNSQISTWQGSSSQNIAPEGNRIEKFTELTVQNGSTTVKDIFGNPHTSNIIDNTTRELQTNSLAPGNIKLNYIDQYGNNLKTMNYPINKDNNYIGQFLRLRTKDYVINNMPENYMWAIDEQVPIEAQEDSQSGGDSTTNADNGDKYGQADIAIVPMEGFEYSYNIYVYGKPNSSLKYEYKDIRSGKIIKSEFKNSEKEKSGTNLPPANFGNTIDWENEYYTTLNVPSGYHYATSQELNSAIQPKESVVDSEPETTTIFIYPDKQTVIINFENEDGSPLVNQESPISIDGYSNDDLTYDELVKDMITQPGTKAEEGIFKFDSTDNRGSDTDRSPQSLTIKLVYIKVNMSIKQVYKNDNNQFIYSDIESKKLVNNSSNNYLVTIDDKISDIINELKSKNPSEIQIDYDWYDTVNSESDYILLVDNKPVESDVVPKKDFELVILYTGVTHFEAPDLNYGKIPITYEDNKVFKRTNTSENVSLINTDLTFNWDLIVSLPNGITKKNNSEKYLGGLLIDKDGVNTIIDDSGIKLTSKQDQENPLISTIPIDIKLFQNVGNTLGDYEGKVIWTLQDSP